MFELTHAHICARVDSHRCRCCSLRGQSVLWGPCLLQCGRRFWQLTFTDGPPNILKGSVAFASDYYRALYFSAHWPSGLHMADRALYQLAKGGYESSPAAQLATMSPWTRDTSAVWWFGLAMAKPFGLCPVQLCRQKEKHQRQKRSGTGRLESAALSQPEMVRIFFL